MYAVSSYIIRRYQDTKKIRKIPTVNQHLLLRKFIVNCDDCVCVCAKKVSYCDDMTLLVLKFCFKDQKKLRNTFHLFL